MTNLGDLSGRESTACDVNDAGQVVGGAPVNEQFHVRAFRWQQNGGMQDLGTLGGPDSFARAITASRQAVGFARNADGTVHAVLWGSGGIMDLSDLHPVWYVASHAYDINDAGQVVGSSGTAISA